MSGMAGGGAAGGLWNWCIAGRIEPDDVRDALSGVLRRRVVALDAAPDGPAVRCDVWHVGGDFPTLVDCYAAPAGVAEATAASAVAVRLGRDCLVPDDGLDPSRYVLAEPDGTLRPVHVDEVETDDGVERRHLRPCTGTDPCPQPPTAGRAPVAGGLPRPDAGYPGQLS